MRTGSPNWSRAWLLLCLLGIQSTLLAAPPNIPKQWPDVTGKVHPVAGQPVVLAWTGLGCPMSKLYRPRLARLADEFVPKGVRFFLLNSNSQDAPADLKKLAADFDFPVIRDAGGQLARRLQVERTTEVLLLDANGQIRYRGAVDDQFGFKETEAGGEEPIHPRPRNYDPKYDDPLAQMYDPRFDQQAEYVEWIDEHPPHQYNKNK